MKTEIISVGTEILLGQIVNTNAQYISQKLGELGIDVYYITCVGDNAGRLKEAIEIAHNRADIIITTGGLGPTMDDITKETVCDFLGLELKMREDILNNIKCYFHRINKDMKHNNEKQALFPEEAIILPNNVGTAPGCILEKEGKIYVILPGPPRELNPMFEKHVYPYFSKNSNQTLVSKTLKLFGIRESAAEDLVQDILKVQTNPTIAPLVKGGEVVFRITAKSLDKEDCYKKIAVVEEKLRQRLGEYIFGIDEDTLESVVGNILLKNNIKITIAESCTGGLIANKLTDIPDISNVLKRAFITYSDEAKMEVLGVPKEMLAKYTAVSAQVAERMALGALKAANADLAVASTGYAGPTGENIGLVYLAVTDGVKTRVKELHLTGTRKRIKSLAAKYALNEIRLFTGDKE